MADYTGEKLSMKIEANYHAAEELARVIDLITNKIEEIDETVTSLVQGGLAGSAVEEAAAGYIENRRVLSEYVRRFASLQIAIQKSAEENELINRAAQDAATIK